MPHNSTQAQVLVIPCSGMGKVHGLISREAANQVTDTLMPGQSDTVCLALLVTGDPATREKVQNHPCITVDGCPKLCAKKNVELSGGNVALGVRVYDTLKRHRGAQFGSPTSLSDEGWAAADEIAAEIAAHGPATVRNREVGAVIMAEATKVGIIACSGEEIPAGTISRLATRRVLELLRPQSTVTLCLPLFLAGEEQERRFARQHPTITVDGCDKLCAKRGTEQYSGQVATSLVVTDILGSHVEKCHRSARAFDQADEQAIWTVAERIAAEVDALSTTASQPAAVTAPPNASCGCACGSRPVEGNLRVNGQAVTINALPLIFDHLHRQGVAAGNGSTDQLLEMVRIYHAIEPDEEHLYREALANAYAEYCRSRAKSLVEIK